MRQRDRDARPAVPRGRIRRDEAGASLVEFALVLPIFALLLFGLIDFGIIFGGYVTMRGGVEQGARSASIDEYQYTGSGTCSASDATSNMVCDVAADIGSLPGLASSTISIGIILNGGGAQNTDVTICAKAQMKSLTGLTAFALNGRTMSTTTTIRLEQNATFSAYSTDAGSSTVSFNSKKYPPTDC